MRTALQLARRHLGQVWPNPSVGVVIVSDGRVVAHGVTARGGRPHAETEALAMAGTHARGATLYVTLEPCSHHGKTPPCTDAIISAGIARVVIACRDPNPQVNGKGIAQLRQAGIEIIEGISGREAIEINRGFFSLIEKKRPFISLKLATSLDGKIATRTGDSRWITNEASRRYGHLLRSRYDAIATGIGTVLADDPLLTCRLPGLEDRSPVRIVFDSQKRLPATSQLAKTANSVPVWVISHKATGGNAGAGITLLQADPGADGIDLAKTVKLLAEQGITRLLVEAGGKLSSAFLQSGLVDRMYWFRAPLMIGNDGAAAIEHGLSPVLDDLARWRIIEQISLQSDTLSILECLPASSAA